MIFHGYDCMVKVDGSGVKDDESFSILLKHLRCAFVVLFTSDFLCFIKRSIKHSGRFFFFFFIFLLLALLLFLICCCYCHCCCCILFINVTWYARKRIIRKYVVLFKVYTQSDVSVPKCHMPYSHNWYTMCFLGIA